MTATDMFHLVGGGAGLLLAIIGAVVFLVGGRHNVECGGCLGLVLVAVGVTTVLVSLP